MPRVQLLAPFCVACVLTLSHPAFANETKSYTYDVLGRLVTAQSSGTVNNGEVNSLCYDHAGNRKTYRSSSVGAMASCVMTGTLASLAALTVEGEPSVAEADSALPNDIGSGDNALEEASPGIDEEINSNGASDTGGDFATSPDSDANEADEPATEVSPVE
jgi:hypothetical protein